MTNSQTLIAAAAPALAAAMTRAGIDPTSVVLTPAMHQSDWRDYAGIGIFGTDEATAERARAWVCVWLDARKVSRTCDRAAHAPDFCGRVSVSASGDFKASKALSASHPWRGLAAVASYKVGD